VSWFHQYLLDPIQSFLLGHGGIVAYLIVFGLVFAEDALFIGFVIPGETAAVLGGVLASRGSVDVWVMMGVVVIAAIAGDSVGYEIGRHFGTRILSMRPLYKHQHRVHRAQEFVRQRGAPAVFLGRFIAFFRATVPGLAGMSHMPYRRFLAWNAVGGLVWGVGVVMIGWLAGNSFARVEQTAGTVAAIAVGVIMLGLLVWWVVRGHRREVEEELAPDPIDDGGLPVDPTPVPDGDAAE
jgi:membrane-associated protein